ncbi:SAP domain-containing ribonucleoprotein isoform X2 [Cephus cinctus]|uniref:SAP domain-containing ribonucleoprotein isoform X2 n=1 Tax=Cephus cinctus TaxID=211228 RepID=A0AAJ7W4U4_CEPCN|nr:SAP domain-containing ribonucleoprotein isoform X2 [Cephus cinctus]
MADSSYEKGLTELSKMKVADLKAELKRRGLSTTGNKTELVERLQLAIHGDSTLSLDETAEEILDEDAVLGDEEIEELSSKPDSHEITEKRKLSTDSNIGNPKKIVLNRNPIIEEIQIDQKKENENDSKKSESGASEKKVIKLSQLGVKEHTTYDVLKKRAERFGASVSTLMDKAELEARIEKRKARFGEVKPVEKVFQNKIKIVK